MIKRKCSKHVRTLTDSDAEAYHQLRTESIQESPEFACPAVVRELLLARMQHNVLSIHSLEGGRAWGAVSNGVLVGAVAASRYLMLTGEEFYLWGLYVRLDHRGSRVALSLFLASLQWCRSQHGIKAIRIYLHRDELRIKRWCQRNGFESIEDSTLAATQLQLVRLDLRVEDAGSVVTNCVEATNRRRRVMS